MVPVLSFKNCNFDFQFQRIVKTKNKNVSQTMPKEVSSLNILLGIRQVRTFLIYMNQLEGE